MKSTRKKFFKVMRWALITDIWKLEFEISVIKTLTLNFCERRLKHLKEKLVNWKAKDPKSIGRTKGDKNKGGAQMKYDGTKKLEGEIEKEENAVKGCHLRIQMHTSNLKKRKGRLLFLEQYIRGEVK